MVRQCTYKLELAVVTLPAGAVAYGMVTDPLVLDSLMLVTSPGHRLAAAVPTTLVESNERLGINTTAGRAARHIIDSDFAAAGPIPPARVGRRGGRVVNLNELVSTELPRSRGRLGPRTRLGRLPLRSRLPWPR